MNSREIYDADTLANLKLNGNEDVEFDYVDPFELLVPNRFDLVAKYLFLLFKYNNINSNLAKNIYHDHIEIFSEGRFYEPGSTSKLSYNDFLEEFSDIYESINRYGFDEHKSIVPVGSDGCIINGGHRIACCMFLNQKVRIARILQKKGPLYNYIYFQKRNLSPEYLDYIALSYLHLTQKNVYAICLWPRATVVGKISEVEDTIKRYAAIVYKKSVSLNYDELRSLMTIIYKDQDWIGNQRNNYAGVYGKLDKCYRKGDTTFYFVEALDLQTVLKLKEDIRGIYNIEKHSVHITDSTIETINVANTILNENAIDVIKHGEINKIDFDRIELASSTTKTIALNPDYTIRAYGYNCNEVNDDIFVNSEELGFDISYDTGNFFVINGIEFLALERAYEIGNDVQKRALQQIIIEKGKKRKNRIASYVKRIWYVTIREMKRFLRNIGLYETVKKALHR